jgi:membrane protease YdiL (CAAX protease family)
MTQNLLDDDLKSLFVPAKGINKYDIGIQFLIWIGIFFGCFIIAQTVSAIIIFAYYKSVDIKQIASNVYNLNALRYAQMIASLLGFLLPALLFSKLKENSFTKYVNANIGFNPLFLVLIPMLIYAFYPLINVSFFVNKIMPWNDWRADYQSEYKFIVDGLLKDNSWFVLVLNMLTIAIIPAICEEWIFRGTLQKLFSEKLNIHLAILFSSIIFSFIHFEFSGFLPRIILGMFLGYLFYYSGSLWLNIFAHAVNNGSHSSVDVFK